MVHFKPVILLGNNAETKKLDEKTAQSLFKKIDDDGNGELSWQEICNNRDRECKTLKNINTFMYVTTFANKGSLKQYKENRSKIKQYQRETDNYREMKNKEKNKLETIRNEMKNVKKALKSK